jgi:hypothetical protein
VRRRRRCVDCRASGGTRASGTAGFDTTALNELGDGVAHAAWTLAKSKAGLFEDGRLRARRARGPGARALAGPLAVR